VLGAPKPGEIDFTPEGGRLWLRYDSEVFESGGPSFCGYGELNEDDVTFRSEYLGTTEQVVQEIVAKALDGGSSEILSIEGPDPIGPWRNYWWEAVHHKGYRMVVVELPTGQTERLPDSE
jgi:hypothetical protein